MCDQIHNNVLVNLITPKAAAKPELLFNKPASQYQLHCNTRHNMYALESTTSILNVFMLSVVKLRVMAPYNQSGLIIEPGTLTEGESL
jgi:hypothetical protein